MEIDFLKCCAVCEITGLDKYKKPAQAVAEVVRIFYDLTDSEGNGYNEDGPSFDTPQFTKLDTKFPSFLVFTEAGTTRERGKYGKALAEYIAEHKLGKVGATEPAVSSRSGNKVTVFVWTVNHENMKKWVKKNKDLLCDCPLHDLDDEE